MPLWAASHTRVVHTIQVEKGLDLPWSAPCLNICTECSTLFCFHCVPCVGNQRPCKPGLRCSITTLLGKVIADNHTARWSLWQGGGGFDVLLAGCSCQSHLPFSPATHCKDSFGLAATTALPQAPDSASLSSSISVQCGLFEAALLAMSCSCLWQWQPIWQMRQRKGRWLQIWLLQGETAARQKADSSSYGIHKEPPNQHPCRWSERASCTFVWE